jgi:hypothetical protein
MFGVDAAVWTNPLWQDSTGRGGGPTAALVRQSWYKFLHQYRLPAGNPYIYSGPLSLAEVTELSASGAKDINLMYVPLHGAPKKLSYNSSDLVATLDALAPLAASIEASADKSLREKSVVCECFLPTVSNLSIVTQLRHTALSDPYNVLCASDTRLKMRQTGLMSGPSSTT